ncbi:uncharacterized protein TNCV_2572821 [Trichonephila clavipes]|nr:uncharacterized protein TNCV_2572821 [Trichonephila clavipes]
MGVKGSTCNGGCDPKYPSARCLHMVREDTRAPSEGAMVADEAFFCTCAFLTMWRYSRRLVCRGGPEPGLHVNEMSLIHCSQHLLTTQSELPN